MEMSNLVAKLKSLKLELGEDLIVHLILISLPTHFGQFKNKKMKNIKGAAEGYDYLYLIHERSQSLYIFKSFKVEVEYCGKIGKKIKVVKSDHGGEYYGRYDGSGEQRPRPFALFLKEYEIVLQYTMPGKPSMNNMAE
ncbi:hypothetical protein CR513_02034, partial [Mucuna pruriens]